MSSKPSPPAAEPVWQRLYRRPYLLLSLAVLFWSANLVIARGLRFDVPPLGLAFWRWIFALAILIPFVWPHLKRDLPILKAQWRIILVLSATGVAGYNAFVYVGVQTTTAVNGVLMQSGMPVMIILISLALFRQGISSFQAAGIVFSLGGVLTILSAGNMGALASLAFNSGDLWVIAGVISYAIYSALLRERPRVHPASFLAATFAIGALLILPFYIGESLAGRTLRLNAITVLAVAYVAIFPSVLSFLFYNRGVELAGANRAGMFIHLLPVFGTLLAVAFLGELLRLFHLVGFILILGGIFMTTREGR